MLATLAAILSAAAVAVTPPPAEMAPAGRTAHFQFHGTPATQGTIDKLVPIAEGRYQRLCRLIEACDVLTRPIDVYVAEDPESFASAFPDGSPMAEWAVGVAFPKQYRIVLRAFGSALFSVTETFDHEVSHIMIYAAAGDTPLPRWFVEGLAIWHADESVLTRLESAQRAAITDNLLTLHEMDRRFPNQGIKVSLAYAQSALFVRYLARNHGPDVMPRLVAQLRAGATFPAAFETVFGEPAESVAVQWEENFSSGVSAWTVLRDGTFLWVAMVFLFVWAYLIKRRERKLAFAEMGENEEAEAAWAALQAARADGDDPTVH